MDGINLSLKVVHIEDKGLNIIRLNYMKNWTSFWLSCLRIMKMGLIGTNLLLNITKRKYFGYYDSSK